MCLDVDEGGRPALIRRPARRIGLRTRHDERLLRERVILLDGDAERLGPLGRRPLAMAEPVVNLELHPRSGEHIEGRRGNEGCASQKPAADNSRIGIEEAFHRREGAGDGNVAAEPRAGHPHAPLGKVIERTVRRSRATNIAVLWLRRLGFPRFRVTEIEAPQVDPQRDQVGYGEEKAQAVPDDPAVEQTEQVAQQPFQ